MSYPCKIPKLIDINAKSRLIRGKDSLLIIGRCVEVEHPRVLEEFLSSGRYAVVSVCLEEEHVNHVGLKLAGVLARSSYKEVAVLTVDGSLHCVQLHHMVEEVFKVMGIEGRVARKHYVIEDGKVIEVSSRAVKVSRYLSKVDKLLRLSEHSTKVI